MKQTRMTTPAPVIPRHNEQVSRLPLIERIERALVVLAYLIEQYGDVYLPMYEQFERELKELKKRDETKKRAHKRLAPYLDSNGGLKLPRKWQTT